MRFLSIGSSRIVRGIVQLLFFAAAAKLMGGIKEIVVAAHYGTSATLDGYLFVYEWNFWSVSVIVSLFIFVAVPHLVQLRLRSVVSAQRFISESIGILAVIGLGIGLLMWAVLPHLMRTSGIAASLRAQSAAVYTNFWLPWLIAVSLVSGVFTAILISRERHWGNLLEGIPALGICLAICVWTTDDARPIVWGTIVGFVGQMLILGALVRSYGDTIIPRLHFSKELWQQCVFGLWMISVGQAILSVSGLIDTMLAARLGEGFLSQYNYALRVCALLLGIFASGFGRACLPVFSDLLLKYGYVNARTVAIRWSYISFGLGIGIALIGVFVAPIVVRLLFERGAFTSQDTLAVSHVLKILIIQSPFYLMWIVLQTWCVVSRNYHTILVACAIAISVKLITGVWLSTLLGVAGVALSTVAMYSAAVGYTWIRITRGR